VSLFGNKIKAIARWACWRFLTPVVTKQSGVTLQVRSDSDWEILKEIFIERYYDNSIHAALHASLPGRPIQVLDLGANVGFFASRCIDLYREAQIPNELTILAVEGSPSAFGELQRRAGLLSAEGVTLTVRQGLVGCRSGDAKIYSSPFSSMTNSVVPANGKTSRFPVLGRHAENSRYIDLLDLVSSSEPIDLLKCDIEGSELDFLRNYGDLLRCTRFLIIELHPGICDMGSCEELLNRYGFAFQRTVFEYPTYTLRMYRGPYT
jgi:FkbM family methyltransferase